MASVFSTPSDLAGLDEIEVASEKESGAAIPKRPIVMIGSGISTPINPTIGDKEETAVRRLNASSAIEVMANNFFVRFCNYQKLQCVAVGLVQKTIGCQHRLSVFF